MEFMLKPGLDLVGAKSDGATLTSPTLASLMITLFL